MEDMDVHHNNPIHHLVGHVHHKFLNHSPFIL